MCLIIPLLKILPPVSAGVSPVTFLMRETSLGPHRRQHYFYGTQFKPFSVNRARI